MAKGLLLNGCVQGRNEVPKVGGLVVGKGWLWWLQFALVFRSNVPRLTAPAGSGRLGGGVGVAGGVFEQGGKGRRKGLKRVDLERMGD